MEKSQVNEFLQNDLEGSQITGKHRVKLITQNRQLYRQIFKLEEKVNALLNRKFTHDFQQNISNQQFESRHQRQTKSQVAQINKLKKQILFIKSTDLSTKKQDVLKAEDQLKCVKKEREKYAIEKKALQRKRGLKDQLLELNHVIKDQRKNLKASFAQAIRQSRELFSEIPKIQRQILDCHKIKELAKTCTPRNEEQIIIEINKVDLEIKRVSQEVKGIRKQWQPKIEALDSQYDHLRNSKTAKQQQLESTERQIEGLKLRILGIKDEYKILEDRKRVASVVISPQKRSQLTERLQQQKRQRKFIDRYRKRPSHEAYQSAHFDSSKFKKKPDSPSNNNKNIDEGQGRGDINMDLTEANQQQQGQSENNITWRDKNLATEKLKKTISSAQNQFATEENTFKKQELQAVKEKPEKVFESIAVGTTFYYDENEQESPLQ